MDKLIVLQIYKMQLSYIMLTLVIITVVIGTGQQQDSCHKALDCNFYVQNRIGILNCSICGNNITEVNEEIREHSSDSSILGMRIVIAMPLYGDMRLDMLANNILYLAISNQQQQQPVSLTATENVPNLRTLAIRGKGSYVIADSAFFSHFPRIEKITLDKLSFLSLPSFSQLYTLTYLNIYSLSLSHSSNTHVGEEFVGGLYRLKHLLVSSNRLTLSLSELAFRGLTSLTSLYLLNSNIRSLSENQFRDSRALSYISFSRNDLTFLSSQTFQQLPRLAAVDVSHNPLNCSCPLQWMSVAVNKFNLNFNKPSCHYPQESVNASATSPSLYRSCPPLSLSLQCLNRSNPLCPSSLSCYDTATRYQCSACPPGYGQVSDSECVDLDACSRAPSPCGDTTTCVNIVGTFLCLPPNNPCDLRNGGCEQKCEFDGSSHWCTCYTGFVNDTWGECRYETSSSSLNSIRLDLLLGILIPLCLIPWMLITVIVIIVCCYKRGMHTKYHILVNMNKLENPDIPAETFEAIPLLDIDESGDYPACSDSRDEI